jgi:hypothetical protein
MNITEMKMAHEAEISGLIKLLEKTREREGKLEEAGRNVLALMIPGVTWSCPIGQEVKRQFEEALNLESN